MPAEPSIKRTIAFFDGQNLFYAAKYAFGYSWPNYDPLKLAQVVCLAHNWCLVNTCFYTGLPSPDDDPFWNHFWTAKLAQMGRVGVRTFSRSLKYRNQTVRLPNAGVTTVLVGNEKGIDVRLALDVVAAARNDMYDVALIFSQDQDLSEVADEVRAISVQQDRWIKIACAFPVSPTYDNTRGINRTDWLRIDRTTYDNCLDPRDYRPRDGH
ncbi:MAG: NYN domain-containing protein [Phycisphaerales bacterium]